MDAAHSHRAPLIAMCGLPFSGKSTLARALGAWLPATVVEVDAVVLARPHPPGAPIPDSVWIAAYREAERQTAHALADGQRVVYDGVNFRSAMRWKLRRVAATHAGTSLLVVRVETPLDEIMARRATNRQSPRRVDVDDTTFEMVRRRFQEPTGAEWVIGYDGSEPVDRWLCRHADDFSGRR